MAGFGSGLFWGAVFGGLAGLMNAPRKGSQTRQLWKNRIDQLTDDVDDFRYKVDNLSMAVQRLADEGISSVNDAVDSVEVSVQHFQEEAGPRIKRVQRRVTDLQETVEEQKQLYQKSETSEESDDTEE